MSKFKSSSTDDVRLEEIKISDLQEQNKLKGDATNPECQVAILDPSQLDTPDSMHHENLSVCSSCSSLSLPEDLVDIQPSTDQSGQVEETAFIQPIDDVNSSSENDINFQDLSDSDGPIWKSSIIKALEALNKGTMS